MTEIHIDIREKIYPKVAHSKCHVALGDLQISLKSGEFVCLLGPSGCGKTTLLNILAGLDQDYSGEIRLIHGNSHEPVMAYVFQNPRLLPWRTVRENLELALAPDQSGDHLEDLLATLGLGKFQNVYPERLSLGMSRRVSLARAFAIKPDLLLMDEPFVSLDAPNANRVRNLLIDVWRQRPHTVLFVTHDLREAITLADRMLFLSSSPARVVEEVIVDIERSRRFNEDMVESFRKKLLADHPETQNLL